MLNLMKPSPYKSALKERLAKQRAAAAAAAIGLDSAVKATVAGDTTHHAPKPKKDSSGRGGTSTPASGAPPANRPPKPISADSSNHKDSTR
jgi:hypothetical protein